MRYAKNHCQKRQWFSSYIQSPMGKVKLSPQLSPQLSPYQSPMGKVKTTTFIEMKSSASMYQSPMGKVKQFLV